MLLLVMIAAAGAAGGDFKVQGGRTVYTSGSSQRLICRSRPTLGSRITRTRSCMTREQWRIYDNDMEQSRRDIADRGARGCDLERAPEC